MRFQLQYSILLIITLVFGSVHITGSAAVSYIVTCIAAILCFIEKVPYPHHRAITTYTVFIAIYSLNCIFYGYVLLLISSLVGFYFVSYIWIWATYILIKKYHSIKALLYTLLLVGFVNAVVTIGQRFMYPLALAIPEILQKKGSEKMDLLINQIANEDYGFALWGIFDMVANGYFSCVTAILSVYICTRVPKIYSILLWALSIVALFYTQERAALVSGVMFSILYFGLLFTKSKLSWKKSLFWAITPIFGVYLYDQLNIQSIIEGSRYVSFEIGERSQIYEKSYEYLINHLFTANVYDFYFTTKLYPHNIVYNAFIYGTIIGGILILITLVSIIIKGLKIIKSSFERKVSNELLALTFAFMGYNVICLTHNASIVSGDLLFWLLATPVIFMYIPQK